MLSTVIDPELGSDVVSLGMIPRTEISPDGAVIVEVRLTISGCPMRAEIKKMVEQRLLVHPGVMKVRLEWSEMDSDERSAAMSTARAAARYQVPETAIGQRCQVLAISSGKGGVGKSSVTVNLAAGLAEKGFTVGVLDADIWGFSVPRLLGMSDRLDAHEVDGRPHIIPNRKTIGEGVLEVVSTGFLVEESTALMWRGLMLTKAVEQFLRDVAWGILITSLSICLPVQVMCRWVLPDSATDVTSRGNNSCDCGSTSGATGSRYGATVVPPGARSD